MNLLAVGRRKAELRTSINECDGMAGLRTSTGATRGVELHP
jgi:hypothetical protein